MTTSPNEQQPAESDKAFQGFRVYLELGPQRSLRAVGQKLGKSRAQIERWSTRWEWLKRIRAHTQQLSEAKDKKLAEEQLGDLMCRDEVVGRISMLARADIGILFNESGEFDIKEVIKRGLSYLLQSVKTTERRYPNGTVRTVREFKIESRLKALELLAKHHRLFEPEDPDDVFERYGIPRGSLPARLELASVPGKLVKDGEDDDDGKPN